MKPALNFNTKFWHLSLTSKRFLNTLIICSLCVFNQGLVQIQVWILPKVNTEYDFMLLATFSILLKRYFHSSSEIPLKFIGHLSIEFKFTFEMPWPLFIQEMLTSFLSHIQLTFELYTNKAVPDWGDAKAYRAIGLMAH